MNTIHEYAKILLPLFLDKRVIFIVSSDFCHWGKAFNYTYGKYVKESDKNLNKAIAKLDREGMNLIEQNNLEEFNKYLTDTETNICGLHSI